MVARPPYCGLSLKKVAQCVGILDFWLGIVNFFLMIFRLKEASKQPHLQFTLEFVSEHGFSLGTFPTASPLPLELAIASLICYAIEFNMGVVLYIGALKKNLSVVFFWIIVTAGTAAFTGPFIRIYEIITVYDYARELKDEEELSTISAERNRTSTAPIPLNYLRSISNSGNGIRRSSRYSVDEHLRNDSLDSPGQQQMIHQHFRHINTLMAIKELPPPTYEEAMMFWKKTNGGSLKVVKNFRT